MRIIVILLVICCIYGCAPMTSNHVVTGPEMEYQTAAALMKENKFNEATVLFHKIMAESPETQLAIDAHYQIALTHALNDNPEKNYAMAIQEFGKFINLHPSDSRALEAQNWVATLKGYLELKKQNESLKKDNEQLRKNIEELKQLDIRHEERRKGK